MTDNPSLTIYVDKIEIKFRFEITAGYYFEILTHETLQWLGSSKNKITKQKNGKNVCLEITELVLVHFKIVNNVYQHDSRVLHMFIPNISFCQLSDISPKSFIFLKTFNSELSYIEVRFRVL